MQRAEYPRKLCRDGVFTEHGMGYTCELPLLHPGPHASFSSKTSVEIRDRWEAEHPDWEKNIGNLDIEI
jgi:hypothetical protein